MTGWVELGRWRAADTESLHAASAAQMDHVAVPPGAPVRRYRCEYDEGGQANKATVPIPPHSVATTVSRSPTSQPRLELFNNHGNQLLTNFTNLWFQVIN